MKVGDKVWMEEAWEDETGAYHDEVGTVTSIEGSEFRVKFERDDLNTFLAGCTYNVDDYESDILE